jgi:hypothetical protein
MHRELDYRCPDGGPPRGTMGADDSEPRTFVGTLELLRVLDEFSEPSVAASPSPQRHEASDHGSPGATWTVREVAKAVRRGAAANARDLFHPSFPRSPTKVLQVPPSHSSRRDLHQQEHALRAPGSEQEPVWVPCRGRRVNPTRDVVGKRETSFGDAGVLLKQPMTTKRSITQCR